VSEQLPLGAHLVSPRRGYTHHGIYAGDGRVIHYAGFSRGWHRGPVEEVPLDRFSCGHPVAVEADADACFAGPARVDRARLRLGEDRFSLWTNNCEHFCAWCLHGTSRSAQVEALRALLRSAVGVLGRLRRSQRVRRSERPR
jgi:hypothetical protein